MPRVLGAVDESPWQGEGQPPKEGGGWVRGCVCVRGAGRWGGRGGGKGGHGVRGGEGEKERMSKRERKKEKSGGWRRGVEWGNPAPQSSRAQRPTPGGEGGAPHVIQANAEGATWQCDPLPLPAGDDPQGRGELKRRHFNCGQQWAEEALSEHPRPAGRGCGHCCPWHWLGRMQHPPPPHGRPVPERHEGKGGRGEV